MAQEIHAFAFTIAAGTAIATPASALFTMPPRVVQQVNVKVPPGPRGLMGFQLGSTGVQLIPAIPGAFVITDNEEIVWPLENQIDSGSWEAFGYNLGQYPHTLYFRFLCAIPGSTPAPGPALVDLSTLSSS